MQLKAVWPLGVRQCPDKGGAVLGRKEWGAGEERLERGMYTILDAAEIQVF